MTTFILPGVEWAVMLDGILASVRPGDSIQVGSMEMGRLTWAALVKAGRTDVQLYLMGETWPADLPEQVEGTGS